MTKYWDVGKVKTRLGATIGMPQAALLHRLFFTHLCQSLSALRGRRIVCLAPDSKLESFRSELRSLQLDQSWETICQAEGCLGNRMQNWFESVLQDPRRPTSKAILIGADCPTVSVELIEKACDELESHDVVLGPAADGGYYLIGLASPWTSLRFQTVFHEIPWSTNRVLSITRERLVDAGLSFCELEVREDIDTLAELNRLREQLASPFTMDRGRVRPTSAR